MKIAKKNFIFNIINLIFFYILYALTYLDWWKNPQSNWQVTISLLILLLIVYYLIVFKSLKAHITDFSVWFFLLHFLFMFGRIILAALNMDQTLYWNLSRYYDNNVQRKAAFYSLCCIQAIFTGYFLIHRTKEYTIIKKQNHLEDWRTFATGIVLIIITFPLKIYVDYSIYLISKISGEYVINSSTNGVIKALSLLSGAGIIFILSSGYFSKVKVLFFFGAISVYYIISMIVTGDRRYTVTILICSALCYLKKYKIKLRKRTILTLIFLSYIGIGLLTTIKDIRKMENVELSLIFSLFMKYLIEGKIFYELLAEFGLSFFTVVNSINYSPIAIPFLNGKTLITAFLSVIPGIGRILGDFIDSASLSLVYCKLSTFPVGGSLLCDLYGNFGILAPFFGIMVGLFLSKVFNEYKIEYSNYNMARYYLLFYLLLNIIRCDFNEILRVIIYGLILSFTINYFFKILIEKHYIR